MDDAPTVESEARDADRYSEIIQQLMITQQNQSALLEQQAAQLTDAANGLKKADTAYNAVKSDNDSLKAFMKSFQERYLAGSASEPDDTAYGPREWKPPHWDGSSTTFRDFFIRIQSSYRTRAALKPALSASFYWDAINDCLTLEKRARMRGFWAAGGTGQKRDPEEFLSEIERVFADSMEKTTALEKLVGMKHADGQPWQDHLVVFDELLLASDGGQWNDDVKIAQLQKTLCDQDKVLLVAMPHLPKYVEFTSEISRIMWKYEHTAQFAAQHRGWRSKQKGKDTGYPSSAPTSLAGPSLTADGDTVMTATRVGSQSRSPAHRAQSRGGQESSTKPRAKWVSKAELDSRREKGLCFRCGASGHRSSECVYRAAENPSRKSVAMNVLGAACAKDVGPVLEDSGSSEPGKE